MSLLKQRLLIEIAMQLIVSSEPFECYLKTGSKREFAAAHL